MSNRTMWKMIHLLNTLPPVLDAGLTPAQLGQAGIDCGKDTIGPLLQAGVIQQVAGRYVLSDAATGILQTCIVANRRWEGKDMWVDYPKVFVVMPFSEPWSTDVYEKMIKPAIQSANLECIRGDTSVRVGDLTQNIWNELLQAGLVVADVSALNANVFYEVGLAHGLGKEVFILKRKDTRLPADFGGAHYSEYDLGDLNTASQSLCSQLQEFASTNKCQEVKTLLGK